MGYVVYVGADGASAQQIEAARHAFCGPSHVKPCLKSWAKGKERHTLTAQEDAESGAWIRAEHQAKALATKQLSGAQNITFTVKLDT